MIRRLVIHRFRGIREGVVDDFGKVNLLIGPNNSGKTAVLEMLYLAAVCGRECNVLIQDVEPSAWAGHTLNRYDFLGQEPMPRLRIRHGEPSKWDESPAVLANAYELNVELKLNKHPFKQFRLSVPPEKGARKRIFDETDESNISLFRISPQEGVAIPEPMMPRFFDAQKVALDKAYLTYCWEEPWVYKWERETPIDHFAIWALECHDKVIPSAERTLFFDFHTANWHFHKRFTQYAKEHVPDWYLRIAECLGRVFPQLTGAEVEIDDAPSTTQEETGYIRFPGKTRIGIDHFGDGARHAFKALAALVALIELSTEENPGLFLWEDPELFMHPGTLNQLLGVTLELIYNKPIQVFITSQSIELLAFLTIQIQKREMEENFRVFRMGLENGHLLAASFKYENIHAWLKWGMDPRSWIPEDIPLKYTLVAPEQEE